MTYQWLLFDADGTLFDYDLAESKALEATFRDFHLQVTPQGAGIYRKINQQIWLDFEQGRISAEALRLRRFELMFEALELSADAQAFSQQYLVNLSRQTDLMPGAEETVQTLADQYQLALITNGLKMCSAPGWPPRGSALTFKKWRFQKRWALPSPTHAISRSSSNALAAPQRNRPGHRRQPDF